MPPHQQAQHRCAPQQYHSEQQQAQAPSHYSGHQQYYPQQHPQRLQQPAAAARAPVPVAQKVSPELAAMGIPGAGASSSFQPAAASGYGYSGYGAGAAPQPAAAAPLLPKQPNQQPASYQVQVPPVTPALQPPLPVGVGPPRYGGARGGYKPLHFGGRRPGSGSSGPYARGMQATSAAARAPAAAGLQKLTSHRSCPTSSQNKQLPAVAIASHNIEHCAAGSGTHALPPLHASAFHTLYVTPLAHFSAPACPMMLGGLIVHCLACSRVH